MTPKKHIDSETWWARFGLRHYVPGESFEDSMRWAYEQGVLADQLDNPKRPHLATTEFGEVTQSDEPLLDRLVMSVDEENPLMKVDGFDDCLIGTVERFAQPRVLLYSVEKMIQKLVSSGMEEEDAWEYFYFNISGAWVGEGTPAFAHLLE